MEAVLATTATTERFAALLSLAHLESSRKGLCRLIEFPAGLRALTALAPKIVHIMAGKQASDMPSAAAGTVPELHHRAKADDS